MKLSLYICDLFRVRNYFFNMDNILFWAIITILVNDFGFERYLSYLNIKSSKNKLPKILSDIYDIEKYGKQQEYFRTNSKFSVISSTFTFAITLLMYALGGFGWLDHYVSTIINNEILRSLVFFGILFLVNDILLTPFSWYDTFIIEQKFDFNKVTPLLFFTDKLKGYALNYPYWRWNILFHYMDLFTNSSIFLVDSMVSYYSF